MTETRPARPKTSGPGRVLIAFYFVMTLGALARSLVQLTTEFEEGPIPILLSLFSGIVYLIATISLIRSGRGAYRIAFVTILIELVGVVVVGTLTIVFPGLVPPPFTHVAGRTGTVWGYFGLEYLLLPLALPVLGLLFLRSQRAVFAEVR